MKRPPRLLLDCDGVLADFTGGALRVVRDVTKRHYNEVDVTTWEVLDSIFTKHPDDLRKREECEKRFNQEGFVSDLNPLPGSIQAVREMLDAGVDLHIVTSALHSSPTWVYERTCWLKKWYGIDKKRVHYTHTKYIIDGDLLVDDKPEHIKAWIEHRPGPGFLWSTGCNQYEKELDRLNSWGELLERVMLRGSRPRLQP
jgi:5'(3')-deoxyribonucleotidase